MRRYGSGVDVFAALSDEERGLLREQQRPEWVEPMKAVLTDERFCDPGWIYERKLDGIRCVAIRDGGPVRLLSRNDLSLNDRYPEVAAALDAQAPTRFAVDGEVVAFDRGADELRAGSRSAADAAVAGLPLRVRRAVARRPRRARAAAARAQARCCATRSRFDGPLRLTPHRNGDGDALLPGGVPQGLGGR